MRRGLDDRPVAGVHFDLGVARVDELRRHLFAVVQDLDPDDLPGARLVAVLQRHDRVLDGDEIPVAEVAGGAVIGLPEVVGRIQLDEARSPVAQQGQRQQPHLALQLALDVGDHPFADGGGAIAARPVGGVAHRRRGHDLRGTGLPELGAQFGTKRIELRIVVRANGGVVGAFVEHAEEEERRCGGDDGDDREEAPRNHENSKFGN